MTLRQIVQLFENIATAHKGINDFHFGELWTIEEKMNGNVKYPLLIVSPISYSTQEQVKERSFHFLVCDIPNKDKSNNTNILSETETILDDVIKILRKESDDYELIGDPQLFPFEEEHSDWVSGTRSELTIRTNFASNYCDVPAYPFVSPSAASYVVTIKNKITGDVIATLKGGQSYEVLVASGIQDDLSPTVEIFIIDNL